MPKQQPVEEETGSPEGVIQRIPGGYQAVLARDIAHPRETVWAMLVEPAQLVQWLAPGELELRPGGATGIECSD